MYSKNDYRYYLENQLIHSDDFLAHYGVKGMKWKHHKNSNGDLEFEFGKYGLRIKNPKSLGKDANNIVSGARKQARLNVNQDILRGRNRTLDFNTKSRNSIRRADELSRKNTAPNMYSTRKKSSYTNDKDNYSLALSTGGKTTYIEKYGQNQKKADIKADKKMRRDYINQQNPHTYDKNKSLKQNIEANKKVSRKRKALKAKAYRKVDESYRGV